MSRQFHRGNKVRLINAEINSQNAGIANCLYLRYPSQACCFEPGGGVGRELKKEVWFGVCRRGLQTLILVKTKPAYFASLLDKRLSDFKYTLFIKKISLVSSISSVNVFWTCKNIYHHAYSSLPIIFPFIFNLVQGIRYRTVPFSRH